MDTSRLKNIFKEENFLPYDEGSTLEKLREVLSYHPQLKEDYNTQLKTNTDWVQKAEKNQVFFLVYDTRWRNFKKITEPNLLLKLIGFEEAPVISISL